MIISPFSAAMALSLLSQATEGRTFEEVRKGLHLSGDKATIADQFHQYYGLLQKSAGQSELLIANRIYVQQGHQLKEHFQEVATAKFFSGGTESVDFMNGNDTAKTINQFVKEKTKKKIDKIVEPENFGESSRVFLVNAIYLKSEWLKPFPKHTFKGDFHINATKAIKIDYMSMRTKFWCSAASDLDSKVLILDYLNSNFSFVIMLPNNQTGGLDRLEMQLTNYDLSQIIDQMSFDECDITIPKFKVESSFSLKEILMKVCVSVEKCMFHLWRRSSRALYDSIDGRR